jgi:hypothetical protein
MRVAFEWILAHDDTQVVFGFGEQAVRVDELESARRFERIPLMDVTVNKDSAFVAMRADATLRACECVIDRALRTRVVGAPPRSK